jgi:hypothetical protein
LEVESELEVESALYVIQGPSDQRQALWADLGVFSKSLLPFVDGSGRMLHPTQTPPFASQSDRQVGEIAEGALDLDHASILE